jgi:hypothetical protein
MAMKPWYKVVTPREDLREGRPLDASEFAVHLDQIRDRRAPSDYQDPKRFFERTYLTQNLLALTSEVVRRLSGEKTETSPVFNLSTQFGGGKTHALACLYHLAQLGPDSNGFMGVRTILEKAHVASIPASAVAVFVGTEFDSIAGRGGSDGTPLRKTPWGEVAFQLGGNEGFAIVAQHDQEGVAPGGDVITKMLPKDKPCVVLLDELMNYVSRERGRKSNLGSQLYNFVQNLSEAARSNDRMVLVASIPASELEMSAEDHADFERFKKLLDRLGKAIVMSSEGETSEIIRRRLFEWSGVPTDARPTLNEYSDFLLDHKSMIPDWFPVETAREHFAASYPFHPMVLSVFERKWRSLPRFQQTRGVLRLLALWVARAYQDGFKGGQKDPLIDLGSAPMEDSMFRSAMFEQLGEGRLEAAVTTDIEGKVDSHAMRLDKHADDETIRKGRLHKKVATTIFFESNGGQGTQHADATIPEIRLGFARPDIDLGHLETVLEELTDACYFLNVDRAHYRFGVKENLNKRFADKKASLTDPKVIDDLVKEDVQKAFQGVADVRTVLFPERSEQIPNQAQFTLVVAGPERDFNDPATLPWAEKATRECGSKSREFKSALVWVLPENAGAIRDDAKRYLAWQLIYDDRGNLSLDDAQIQQLDESRKKAQRDFKEAIWRSYRHLALLGKDQSLRTIDLGLVHSSAAPSLVHFILNRLKQDEELIEAASPSFLIRNWPPAFKEQGWPTKQVRDAFFSSPLFPRILKADAVKETIARGVSGGFLAYASRRGDGTLDPFLFGVGTAFSRDEVELNDEVVILTKEAAEAHLAVKKAKEAEKTKPLAPVGGGGATPTIDTPYPPPPPPGGGAGDTPAIFVDVPLPPATTGLVPSVSWTGEVPHLKWMTFYSKVLTKYATSNPKLTVSFRLSPEGGMSKAQVEELQAALRELGLEDGLK